MLNLHLLFEKLVQFLLSLSPSVYNFAASLFLPAQPLYLVAVVDVVEDGSWKLAVPNL